MKNNNRDNGNHLKIMTNILEDISDMLLTGGVCRNQWGEITLPYCLRQHYEEKESKIEYIK